MIKNSLLWSVWLKPECRLPESRRQESSSSLPLFSCRGAQSFRWTISRVPLAPWPHHRISAIALAPSDHDVSSSGASGGACISSLQDRSVDAPSIGANRLRRQCSAPLTAARHLRQGDAAVRRGDLGRKRRKVATRPEHHENVQAEQEM